MRIALVSPYSWSQPGGVTRHIEALAAEHVAAGHDVRVIAPYDGDPGGAPEWLVSLGPTIGLPVNGAVSHLAHTHPAAPRLDAPARRGGGPLGGSPPPGAGRAAHGLDDAGPRRRAGRRHV